MSSQMETLKKKSYDKYHFILICFPRFKNNFNNMKRIILLLSEKKFSFSCKCSLLFNFFLHRQPNFCAEINLLAAKINLIYTNDDVDFILIFIFFYLFSYYYEKTCV